MRVEMDLQAEEGDDVTRVFSLVFDYDLAKMEATGRHWASEAYRGKDHIFEYSAASIATFLHHNPKRLYTVHTDDCYLLLDKLSAYDVSLDFLDTVDASERIREWCSHWYSFWPLIKVAEEHYTGDQHALKLDNDLTCLKPIDDLLERMDSGQAIAWKFERQCSKGRDYWGESYAARRAFGTDEFAIFNTGVLGMPKHLHEAARTQIRDNCERMIAVDISPVHRFPDKPGVVAKTYNVSDQVAVNYFLHQRSAGVTEAWPWFDHHCYSKTKQGVIDAAAYLRKSP